MYGARCCGAAAVLLLLLSLITLSEGCSCPLRHPQQHYCEADFVANVKVRRVVTLPDGQSVLRVRVRRLLKSTPKATAALSKKLIYTIPGTCSINVTSRSMHVITGDIQAGKPWTSACHFAAPWTTLAPKMKKGFRLLYQTGCDCPIMSCHWWERHCPTAAFYCSWRTSTDSDDCQARHGVCLRRPTGGCGWLGGRLYRGCMKKWRSDREPGSPQHNTNHIRNNVATLIEDSNHVTTNELSHGDGKQQHHHRHQDTEHGGADEDDSILSNDVVDGIVREGMGGRRRDDARPTARREDPSISSGLTADTTYSFGPTVVATSRFHKPRKPKPSRPHANSIYHGGNNNRYRKPVKHGSSIDTINSNSRVSSHTFSSSRFSGNSGIGSLFGTSREGPFENHGEQNKLDGALPTTASPSGLAPTSGTPESSTQPASTSSLEPNMGSSIEDDELIHFYHSTNHVDPKDTGNHLDLKSAEFESELDLNVDVEPYIEVAGVYHRRRYPEYTTRIGYIPEN